MLRIPDLLGLMIVEGRWPKRGDDLKQNLTPLAAPERIRQLAPGESRLYLYPPPFRAIRERPRIGNDPFWNHLMSASWEIDFNLAIEIADFGIGSDSPILLDYRTNLEKPSVIRLQWGECEAGSIENHWVEMAPDFETFVRVLGL